MTTQRRFSFAKAIILLLLLLLMVSGCEKGDLKGDIDTITAKLDQLKQNADAVAAAQNNLDSNNAAALAKITATTNELMASIKKKESREIFEKLLGQINEANHTPGIGRAQVEARVGLSIVESLRGKSPEELMQIGIALKILTSTSAPGGGMAFAQSMTSQMPWANNALSQWNGVQGGATLGSVAQMQPTGLSLDLPSRTASLYGSTRAPQSTTFDDSAAKMGQGILPKSELKKARGFGLEAMGAGRDH